MAEEKKTDDEKSVPKVITNHIYLCLNGAIVNPPASTPNTNIITIPEYASIQNAINNGHVPNINVLQPNINAANQAYTFRMNTSDPNNMEFQIIPIAQQQQADDMKQITDGVNAMFCMMAQVEHELYDVPQLHGYSRSEYPNLARLADMGVYHEKNKNRNKNKNKKLLANRMQTTTMYNNNKKKNNNCGVAIFEGVKCAFDGIIPPNYPNPQSHPAMQLMSLYGAQPIGRLTTDVTHLIGYKNVVTTSPNKLLWSVHWKWVIDSIKQLKRCDERLYLIDGSKYSYNYYSNSHTQKQISNDKYNDTNGDIDMVSTCTSNDSISKANMQSNLSLPNLNHIENNNNKNSNKLNGKYHHAPNKPHNNYREAMNRHIIQSPLRAQNNNSNNKDDENAARINHRKMRNEDKVLKNKNNNNIYPSQSQSKPHPLQFVHHHNNNNSYSESPSHSQNGNKNKRKRKRAINPMDDDDECDEPVIKKRRISKKSIQRRGKRRKSSEKYDMKSINNNNKNNNNNNTNNSMIPPPLLPPQNNGQHVTNTTKKNEPQEIPIGDGKRKYVAFFVNGKWEIARTETQQTQQWSRYRIDEISTDEQKAELNNGKKMSKKVKVKRTKKSNPNHLYVDNWVKNENDCDICYEKNIQTLQLHMVRHVRVYQKYTTGGTKPAQKENSEYEFVIKISDDCEISVVGVRCLRCNRVFKHADIENAIGSWYKHKCDKKHQKTKCAATKRKTKKP